MTEPDARQTEPDARQEAIDRLNAKRGFWGLAASGLAALVITTTIWALTDPGYFWPIWVVFGIGIALLAKGWQIWGPKQRGITEADIQREMGKR